MGLFDWASRQPGRWVNYGKKVIAADDIAKGGQFIGDMTRQLGHQEGEGRQETFENACQRLGLAEADLAESYRYYAMRFNLFLFFGSLAVVTFFWYAFKGSFSAFAILGFLAICLSQLFNASFRMMQIRHHELRSVAYWLANPNEWWIRAFVPRHPTDKGNASKAPKLSGPAAPSKVVPLRPRDRSGDR